MLLPALCLAALPPGWEDELYCPRDECLKGKHPPHKEGLTGPRLIFHECCNQRNGETSRPRPWGFRVDRVVKDNLLDAGWHTTPCNIQFGECPRRDPVECLSARFDLLGGRAWVLV